MTKWAGVVRGLVFRNGITLFGALMTTVSAGAILLLVALSALQIMTAPYAGIITFLVLPVFFVLGLLIIPFGHYLARMYPHAHAEDAEPGIITIDLRKAATWRAFLLIMALTIVNVGLISSVGYKGVHYSESVQFCGTVCHTVMEPEYTAYLDSPHSKVTCAECHIGPGAPWFVQSKLSGMGQVFAVLTNTYRSPVPTPVHNLRPSRDTCEECHWPEKFTGDRVKVHTRFSDDEANTALTTVLLMHIGGGNAQGRGIHNWHIDPDKTTLYLPGSADHQTISLVRVKHADGRVQNYSADGFERDPATIPDTAMEEMDCITCHNRPTHVFQMPNEAIDIAMSRGSIDNTLPYIKKVAVEALEGAAKDPDPADHIRRHVLGYYQANHGDVLSSRKDTVETAILRIQDAFNRNVFPKMNVTWGTYPNNISHIHSAGCFRCHDDGHSTKDGAVISQDCTACHQVLAWDEPDPQIAQDLGIRK